MNTAVAKKNGRPVGRPCPEETRRKISEALKRVCLSEEKRRKMSEASKGRRLSEEARRKIAEAQRGRHHSEETKRKIGDAARGRKMPEDMRQKLSKLWTGRHHSEETKRRISEGNKGKVITEEMRKRRSEIATTRVFPPEVRKKMSTSITRSFRPADGNYPQKLVRFALKAPDNKVYEGVNLRQFADEHRHLFDDCYTVRDIGQRLSLLNPKNKRGLSTWKGWTWVSQVERMEDCVRLDRDKDWTEEDRHLRDQVKPKNEQQPSVECTGSNHHHAGGGRPGARESAVGAGQE